MNTLDTATPTLTPAPDKKKRSVLQNSRDAALTTGALATTAAGLAVARAAHSTGKVVTSVGETAKEEIRDASGKMKAAPAAAAKKAKNTLKKQLTTFPTFRKLGRAVRFAAAEAEETTLLGGPDQPRDEKQRFLNPISAVAAGGPLTVQAVKRAQRKGKEVERTARRASGLAKDVAAAVAGKPRERDAAGRQKKREYEKPWVKRAAAGAAGVAGLALVAKNPKLGKRTVQGHLNRGLAAARKAAPESARDFVPGLKKRFPDPVKVTPAKAPGKVAKSAPFRSHESPTSPPKMKPKRKKIKVISAVFAAAVQRTVTHLAEVRPDWEVDRISNRQARVSAPGSQRRERRKKRPLERVENERKLKNVLIAGALVAGSGAGFVAGKNHLRMGKAIKAAKRSLHPAPRKNRKTKKRADGTIAAEGMHA